MKLPNVVYQLMKDVVQQLVSGEHEALVLNGFSVIDAATLQQLLASQPGTPTMPPDKALKEVPCVAFEDGTGWGFEVPLWYDGAPTDLTAFIDINQEPDGTLEPFLWSLRVP